VNRDSNGSSSIIVIGVSLGGVDALQQLAKQLPAGFPAPVVIVQHIGQHRSRMPTILSERGPLPAVHVDDGQPPLPGRIYVAPPDHHVLLDGDSLRLSKGPKEHHARPAIDPLFRSAALSRGKDVIGVVLTGLLDDGTAGLQAIKQCGGVAVVQDPYDAFEPSMPLSALKHVEVDHCVPLAELGPLLCDLVVSKAAAAAPPRHEPSGHEHALFLSEGNPMEHLNAIGAPSTFACPDCSGTLWEVANASPVRYRCHTGHAFTLRTLEQTLSQTLDTSLWSAIRALQEKSLVLEKMAENLDSEDNEPLRAQALEDARALSAQADSLRLMLGRVPDSEAEGMRD
jgi:two-component system, chemotaxis family, protein-glutamate methylesterase/glutaminase